MSEPKKYDRGRGDRFTGLGVEVRLDSMYGSSVVVEQTHLLTRLDSPEVVVMFELDDEEVLEKIVMEDLFRGVESVDSAARRLQKQIIRVVERAAMLDPTFRALGSRVTVRQAEQVLEAHGERTWIPPKYLEELRDMKVNFLAADPEDPE